MVVPEYPDWKVVKKVKVHGYPLILITKGEMKKVVSEGYYKLIIEFLLNASIPQEPWFYEMNGTRVEGIDHILHQGFVSGEGWAISGVYYGHLIQPDEFGEYLQDPVFIHEQKRYKRQFKRELAEPVWNVDINSGQWRHVGTYIPLSSINRIIAVERKLLAEGSAK